MCRDAASGPLRNNRLHAVGDLEHVAGAASLTKSWVDGVMPTLPCFAARRIGADRFSAGCGRLGQIWPKPEIELFAIAGVVIE
jgi:hypothetical protein